MIIMMNDDEKKNLSYIIQIALFIFFTTTTPHTHIYIFIYHHPHAFLHTLKPLRKGQKKCFDAVSDLNFKNASGISKSLQVDSSVRSLSVSSYSIGEF